MNNIKAASDSFSIYFIGPNSVGVKITSNSNSLRANLTHLAKFIFSWEWLVLSPLLKVSKHELLILLDIVNQDSLLISIAIPVLGLIFIVRIGILSESFRSFTNTR